MSDTGDFNARISRFYHRWHALERAQGADDGRILDFDFCPREHLVDLEPPFAHRLEALRHLKALQVDVISASPSRFVNHAFMIQKLRGAETYLRALMGERIPFRRCLKTMMGIEPLPVPRTELSLKRRELEARLDRIGIAFSPDAAPLFEQRMMLRAVETLEADLRKEATLWTQRLGTRLGLRSIPEYTIESAEVDAYWANWIDGSREEGIRLQINRHRRIGYHKYAATTFALHEIGGHALHVLELAAAAERGEIDSAALNFTVHSCEAVQMEGLAQSLLFLSTEEGEVPEEALLGQELKAYHGALINNAQIELEAGAPLERVVEQTLRDAPFMCPSKLLAVLRDRGRHPLYRAYIFAYAPGRRLFMRMSGRPDHERMAFLKQMYTALWTPRQIADIVASPGGAPQG